MFSCDIHVMDATSVNLGKEHLGVFDSDYSVMSHMSLFFNGRIPVFDVRLNFHRILHVSLGCAERRKHDELLKDTSQAG